jgi:hypothetical protein
MVSFVLIGRVDVTTLLIASFDMMMSSRAFVAICTPQSFYPQLDSEFRFVAIVRFGICRIAVPVAPTTAWHAFQARHVDT